MVLEAPPKVLGLVDDIWYKWVGDIGITGPNKGEGGKYLFLPPGWKGEVPQGYYVLRPGSYSVWISWRTFLVDGDRALHVAQPDETAEAQRDAVAALER